MIKIPTTIKNTKLVQKRRRQIIEAAIKLFARKGFHSATMRELSRAARISHGNIYDYFGSKEDIFAMIHGYLAEENDSRFDAITRGDEGPLDKLRRMIHSEIDVLNRLSEGTLLLYQESHILSKKYLKQVLQREREHVRRYEIILEEGIRAKIFRPVNVRVMANLIKVMTQSWIFKRWDLKTHADQREMEEEIWRLIFQGLLSTNEETRDDDAARLSPSPI